MKLCLVVRLIVLAFHTRTNNESSTDILDVSNYFKNRNKTVSFLSVQGVSGEAGAPGAVGPRVSFHVKA